MFFGDTARAQKVYETDDVKEQRQIAKKIRPISKHLWDFDITPIVEKGCFLKFSQNKELASFLKSKSSRPLVYSTRFDRILGTGLNLIDLSKSCVNIGDYTTTNLLGTILQKTLSALDKIGYQIPPIYEIPETSDIFPHIIGDIHFACLRKNQTTILTSLNRILEDQKNTHGHHIDFNSFLKTLQSITRQEELESIEKDEKIKIPGIFYNQYDQKSLSTIAKILFRSPTLQLRKNSVPFASTKEKGTKISGSTEYHMNQLCVKITSLDMFQLRSNAPKPTELPRPVNTTQKETKKDDFSAGTGTETSFHQNEKRTHTPKAVNQQYLGTGRYKQSPQNKKPTFPPAPEQANETLAQKKRREFREQIKLEARRRKKERLKSLKPQF